MPPEQGGIFRKRKPSRGLSLKKFAFSVLQYFIRNPLQKEENLNIQPNRMGANCKI